MHWAVVVLPVTTELPAEVHEETELVTGGVIVQVI